ncbi:acyl-coenzyme A thioesterase 8 [Strongylocentrotus purpuratus]|uniref:Acyl-coenzyme A thioesterase 8 n=1 Tax=Strongylocentrotus purpuratus TaxID=7668 RepID=A0A7M7TH08_STRPU|nr:acyl-coenzyme A thioesterase 8 [Strongylocentrotus purpuratus]|eukprot:XP_794104.2 PREDICTED: acyl-coenzyme A thioesterase 8 [Strongylocentrotus purpuratus]
MLRSNGRRLLSNLQSLVSRRDKLVNHRKLLSITSSSRMATPSTTDDKEQSETDLRSVLVSTVLDLETLDPYLFRAKNMWHAYGPGKRLFGGQIIGQAMVAAGRTVNPELSIHSLHSYFVKAGDSTLPVLYRVENQRDGNSFCTRSVEAIQNGRIILTMMASYHRFEESPYNHQYTMPDVPDPDTMTTDMEELKQFVQNPDIPEKLRKWAQKQLAQEITFETKRVDRADFFSKGFDQPTEPKLMIWVKVKGDIGENTGEDGMDLQHCCLAYISDLFLAGLTYLPNRDKPLGMMCSLDHSIWFHTPCRIDEWMLYECESPQSSHGRGMTLGRFWRRDGVLAVTVAQEALLRPKL